MKAIESTIHSLRDPCVLYENGKYYMYGTGYNAYYADSLTAEKWEGPIDVTSFPAEHEICGDRWAPEVHKYKGSYYMIASYRSSKTNHRGCAILKSASPLGKFEEISCGHITPHEWDSIDGTLFIDENNAPWLVFVHEWTSTDDGVGRMATARLSDDLTKMITTPIELFRADSPKWSKSFVTDGCFMHRMASGTLLMIWSNWDEYGYCVGIARSKSGKIDGEWTQDETLLFSKRFYPYDGGHGMIFKDAGGQLYLSLHSPNDPQGERSCKPIFVKIKEDKTNDTLVRCSDET